MTFTEQHKKDALEWADKVSKVSEYAAYGGPLVSVLAHFLRKAESDMAELRELVINIDHCRERHFHFVSCDCRMDSIKALAKATEQGGR